MIYQDLFLWNGCPPPKKKRENQGNFAEPGANLSLKKVMVQTNFHMTPTFLGPWFSHSKTPDGQLENPGEIWSEKQKDTTTWTFQFWNAWTKCFRGTGCQFTMTLAGFSLSNPTGRCWSSKLHLSSMAFIASGTFQTKEKNRKRVINIIWDAPAIVFTTQIISILDWVITILTPTSTTGILRGEILTCQKFVPSEKYSHVDMFFPGGVKLTKEYKRPLKPPFIYI